MRGEPIGRRAAEIGSDPRFRNRAVKVHRLGARVTVELLAELAARTDADVVEDTLSRYCALDELTLAVTGGDWIPSLPLRRVA